MCAATMISQIFTTQVKNNMWGTFVVSTDFFFYLPQKYILEEERESGGANADHSTGYP